MAKNKNPDQRSELLVEMVEKNFRDDGSKILFGVIHGWRDFHKHQRRPECFLYSANRSVIGKRRPIQVILQ